MIQQNRYIAALIALLLTCGLFTGCVATGSSTSVQPHTAEVEDEHAAFALLRQIGAGWNLGNTLDSSNGQKEGLAPRADGTSPEEYYETLWGNPVTTKQTIQAVAQAGFGAVRIPVGYYDHMDADFNIRAEWLARVEEVVSYVLDAGMYCIINIHHEDTWLKTDTENSEAITAQFTKVWQQIATHFANYDDHLLFEGFNEVRDTQGRWSEAGAKAYGMINQLNQTFVTTVRNTGGNNAGRYLVLNTYAAAMDPDMLKAFSLPEDTIANRLIASVHFYGRLEFTWHESWLQNTQNDTTWQQEEEGVFVEKRMDTLNKHLVSRGIPVLIGEFAAWNKNNTESRVQFARHYIEAAKQYNIACFWWDDGGRYDSPQTVDSAALLNRYTGEWYYPEIAQALVEASA